MVRQVLKWNPIYAFKNMTIFLLVVFHHHLLKKHNINGPSAAGLYVVSNVAVRNSVKKTFKRKKTLNYLKRLISAVATHQFSVARAVITLLVVAVVYPLLHGTSTLKVIEVKFLQPYAYSQFAAALRLNFTHIFLIKL